MTEMIERVARAIAGAHYSRKAHAGACTQQDRVAYLVNDYWDQFIPDARAAIEAMRVPTEAMAEEGGYFVAGERANPVDARNVWIEMIAAALQAQPKASGS